MKKKINIVGASLYGCLLAYYLSKKNYSVTIYEKSKEILSGFNNIKINKFKLNNGFHGFEYPRAKYLVHFLNNNLNLKLKKKLNIRKLLINREIIDYRAKYHEMPKSIQDLYIRKNLKIYKNQNLNFFFKKKFLNKIKKNSKRFSDNLIRTKHLFIPWFLPSDVTHISKDEGDIYRNLVKKKKIIPYYFFPKSGLFADIKKKVFFFLKRNNVKIVFNSKVEILKNKLIIKNQKNQIIKDHNIKNRTIYCGSATLLLSLVKPQMLAELKIHKRNFYNILIKIPKKYHLSYFTEIICLNDKIYYVNRISRVFNLDNKNYNYIQIEMVIKNIKSTQQLLKNIKKEISKIFDISGVKMIGIDHSRVIYVPPNSWINKATKICKKFIKGKAIEVDNYNFYPINLSKIWGMLKMKLKTI